MNTNDLLNTSLQLGVLNDGQDSHQNNQDNQNGITCRLCNHVFPSFQAFMTHTQSHFAHQNPRMKRLFSPNHVNRQREMIPSPMELNFRRSMMMQETRNFINNRVFQAALPQEPMPMLQHRTNSILHASQQGIATSPPFRGPSQTMPFSRVNVAEMERLLHPPIHQREMEVSPIDGTKPYINLLDKPIDNNKLF
ncbi:hypothetical protein VNO78_20947 [Psophocarpus tetragonolobus]|uniref:C2H2-type domain-containing protein n=1 Tax=Psophocarpus tetragonolobus TaxID=3891 RepID=A0AAN9SBC7_PSOTE